jgi:predicted amino acid-binding ACT domain protein
MILIADVSSPACDLAALTEELRAFGREQNLQIRVQRSEIFEAMHQV